MPLEHQDDPRFTPEQRDEILNLANRLQAQHEATVGADELVRVAEEAGIDPRFVHEAAMRLGTRSRLNHRSLALATTAFSLQAFVFLFCQNIGIGGSRGIASHEVIFAATVAFVLGVLIARDKAIRWYVPLTLAAGWIVAGMLAGVLGRGEAASWLFNVAATFGGIQLLAALCGSALAAGLDRSPESSKRISPRA